MFKTIIARYHGRFTHPINQTHHTTAGGDTACHIEPDKPQVLIFHKRQALRINPSKTHFVVHIFQYNRHSLFKQIPRRPTIQRVLHIQWQCSCVLNLDGRTCFFRSEAKPLPHHGEVLDVFRRVIVDARLLMCGQFLVPAIEDEPLATGRCGILVFRDHATSDRISPDFRAIWVLKHDDR